MNTDNKLETKIVTKSGMTHMLLITREEYYDLILLLSTSTKPFTNIKRIQDL